MSHAKIMSFLCSLDNFLLKNVIVFFFENQISKWRVIAKNGYFLTYFSNVLVTREDTQKCLQFISHLDTYTYFLNLLTFLPSQFCKFANLS